MNLKPLVNDPALWESFVEYVQDRLNKIHNNLESSSDQREVFQLQGQAIMCRRLLKLRDEINGR